MRLVSQLLKYVVYPCAASVGYLQYCAKSGRLAIVAYHGVRPTGYEITDPDVDGSLIDADSLRRQLRLLKAAYKVVAPQDVRLWCETKQELPPQSVLLTCDDGLLNNLTEMAPILLEEGLACLFFVTGASLQEMPSMIWYDELYLMLLAAGEFPFTLTSANLGLRACFYNRGQRRSVWWDLVKKLSQFDGETRFSFLQSARVQLGLREDWRSVYHQDPILRRRFLMLTSQELRQLKDSGMSIGAHTHSHPMLSRMPADLAWKEVAEHKRQLEQVIGDEVWALAYPFGDPESVTPRELSMSERAGYKGAFMNFEGGFGCTLPLFALPRIHVTSDMSLAEFEANVSGFRQALRRRFLGEDVPASATQS
jgi:peptidoglycan/xylan/chitin deacetylase (PgdA/CDA1 family)